MRKSKQKNRKLILLSALLIVAVGYALLSSDLSIIGNYSIKKITWDIHFENAHKTNGSVGSDPTITDNDTKVTYSFTLNNPDEYYEFTVDAVNEGSIDGIIKKIENGVYDSTGTTKITAPAYIDYTIINTSTNEDVKVGDVLESDTTETYKVKVGINVGVGTSSLPSETTSMMFKLSIDYAQKKSNGHITYVANTNPNVKGLIGTAYLDPTDYSVTCEADGQTENMPLHAATSWAEIDEYMNNGGYYESATSYASNNNGCMKFYVYKDTGDYYKLILDHNTTAVIAPVLEIHFIDEDTGEEAQDSAINYCTTKYSTESDIYACLSLYDNILKRDTVGWEDENPTMITAEEVAEILEIDNFDVSSYPEDIEIESGYEWLFDNTEIGSNDECLEPSCFVNGFWTNSVEITSVEVGDYSSSAYYNMWGISSFGDPHDSKTFFFHRDAHNDSWYPQYNRNVGIRPVITIPKSYFN